MPRKASKKKREHWTIQDWRGHNYSVTYEKRAYVQALPAEIRAQYHRLAETLPCPKLNLFGVGEYTHEQEQFIFQLNLRANLDVWYLNPWYCTDTGWADFQEQWAALPEPIERGEFIHIPMCTKSQVVPIVPKQKQKRKLYT